MLAIEVNNLFKSFKYYKKDLGLKSSIKNLFRNVKKEAKDFTLNLYPVPNKDGNVRFTFSNSIKRYKEIVEQPAKHLNIVGEEIAIKYKTIMQDPKQFSEWA